MKFWGWGDGQDQPSLCLPWIPRLGRRRDELLTASPCNKTISLKSKIAGRDRMDFGVCIVCHSHEQLLALAVVTCKAELQLALCWIVSAAFCMDNWGELRGNRSSRPLLCQKKKIRRGHFCVAELRWYRRNVLFLLQVLDKILNRRLLRLSAVRLKWDGVPCEKHP